jgi:PAS domain S-box-containing protein
MVMAPGHISHGAAPIPVSLLAFAIFITLSAALLIVIFASRLDRRYTEEIEIRSIRAGDSIRRFRNLLRLSSDLISPLDAQGRLVGEVLSANRLLRYAPGELSGRKFIDLVAQNDRSKVQGWLCDAQHGEPVPRLQCALMASDGAEIFCECSAVRVEDPDSDWSIVISARDLSERRRMESRLYQSQRLEALGQMASGVAHDYSNLLTAVSLNLESIERQLPSTEILERLRLAQAALAHGNSLTRQLLAFARQQKVDPEPIDLNTVVTGIVNFLSLSLRGEVPINVSDISTPRSLSC